VKKELEIEMKTPAYNKGASLGKSLEMK